MTLQVRSMAAAVRDIMKEQAQDIINKLEAYNVPEDAESQQKICDYAIGLKSNNFHWPNHKVARKTAEYFKLTKSMIIVR